ncbi:MAG: ABC transporter ATP-binding protein [Bdellovibrionales bacterium]|nr:ABC transporter ATP-binding protein [Bdellovibrionales bacterium]
MSARHITKEFKQGKKELRILKGLNLELGEGDDVCILGASGTGKSTFLQILGTLDRPTQGQLFYRQEDLFSKSDDFLAQFRNQKMGFVFQFHYLMSEFSAVENTMMPGRIAGWEVRDCRKKAEKLLGMLDLSHRLHHYPSELSGGEKQRVAIARALFCEPEILFADEPTGNLDSQNAKNIQNLFFDLKKNFKLTLVTVTHDAQFASRFTRQLQMADGLWVTPGAGW